MGTTSHQCAISKFPIEKDAPVVSLLLKLNSNSENNAGFALIPNTLSPEKEKPHFLVDSFLLKGTYNGAGGVSLPGDTDDEPYHPKDGGAYFIVHAALYEKMIACEDLLTPHTKDDTMRTLAALSTKHLKTKFTEDNPSSDAFETARFLILLRESGVPLRIEKNITSQFGDDEKIALKTFFEHHNTTNNQEPPCDNAKPSRAVCALTGSPIGNDDVAYIIPLASNKPLIPCLGYKSAYTSLNDLLNEKAEVTAWFSMLSSPFPVVYKTGHDLPLPITSDDKGVSVDGPQNSILSFIKEFGLTGLKSDCSFRTQKKIIELCMEHEKLNNIDDFGNRYIKNHLCLSKSAYLSLLNDTNIATIDQEATEDTSLNALIALLGDMKTLQYSGNLTPEVFIERFQIEISDNEKLIKRLARQTELLSIKGGTLDRESLATILMNALPSVLSNHPSCKYSNIFRSFANPDATNSLHKVIISNVMDSLDSLFATLTEAEFKSWLSAQLPLVAIEMNRCEKVISKFKTLAFFLNGTEKYKGSNPTQPLQVFRETILDALHDELDCI